MYFAKIDLLYRVLKVIAADQDFIDRQPGTWIPCDINGVFPKNYPGPGYTYDPQAQAFIAPKPYPSWSLDENYRWQAPVARPEGMCIWNEATQAWDEVN